MSVSGVLWDGVYLPPRRCMTPDGDFVLTGRERFTILLRDGFRCVYCGFQANALETWSLIVD